MCVSEKMKRVLCFLLSMILVLQYVPAPVFAEETLETGLCEHHAVHENCGYVAAVAGADCTHEHDDSCFTTKCAHVHGDCGYMPAVEGVDCDHKHDNACGYTAPVAEVECTCQQEGHTTECAYAPAIPEGQCTHVHGECSYVEAKEEIPCGHDCAADEACNEKVLNCAHVHSESCGYAEAVEGKTCEFVCETCAAEEAAAAAVAEVKALIDALPEVEAVQAMALEEKKAAYAQTQAANEACNNLTDERKEQLPDPDEVFKPLFDYFNTLIDADGEIGSGTPDGTPPVITSLTITSPTTITVPGTIELVAEATDDVSGVDEIYVEFFGQNHREYLYGSLYATYWNGSERVPYEDGKLHGKITVNQYLESDTFVLAYVSVYDVADNYTRYDRNPINLENHFPLTEYMEALQFEVVESEYADGTSPVMTSLSISATSINAPGTIELVAEATDDVSGVDEIYVEFFGQNHREYLYGSLYATYWNGSERVPYEDGKLHGKITVNQYLESDTFVLTYVSVYDVADNYTRYDRNPINLENHFPLTEYMEALQFEVVESEYADGTSPVMTSLSISATSINAPGTIELVAEATDDVSGVDEIYVEFFGQNHREYLYGSLYATYWNGSERVPYEDGKLHGKITVNQYLESDTFVLAYVSVYDVADNYTRYDRNPINLENHFPLTEYMEALQFEVINNGADVTTSVSKGTFVDEVKNAASDAYIAADYSGNATMPQEAFDAIAGTDKTIDLISEGITWRFEGSDITNTTKPIDLSVQITKAEENTSADSEAIQDKLNGTTGVVMKFAENGELPGKATIQVKVDYAMREYLGSDKGLCVYYYNNQTGELELVAEKLTVINDTYVEFEITHCSYYVLATPVADAEEIIKGTCGANLTWTLSKKTGVLTISGTGLMEDYDWNNQPVWRQWENRSLVTSIVVQSGVTSIGSNAFDNMYNVTSITLPEGITTIGRAAFSGCSSLTELVLPSSVTTIGEDAINYLPGLTTIHIPENVVSIHERNFYGCSSLTAITVAANNPSYSSVNGVLYDKAAETLIYCPDGYADKLVLPASVKTIDFGKFNSCTLLEKIEADQNNAYYSSIDGVLYDKGGKYLVYCPPAYEDTLNLPAKVDYIDTYGLIAAVKLKAISVDPQNATFSSYNGVLYSKSGTELIFCPRGFTGVLQVADNTTSVAARAIQDCRELTTIYFPDTIISIGEWAVSQNNKLNRIVFTGAAPSFGDCCFGNLKTSVYYPAGDASWDAAIKQDCGGDITWVPISESGICGDDLTWTYERTGGTLTITGSGEMYDYSPATSPWKNYYVSNVIFSGNITSIGSYAFSGCKELRQVSIPNTVNRMGTAFYDCTDLERVDIPASVTEITGVPAYQCYNLKTIMVDANNPNYNTDEHGALFNGDKTVLLQAPTAMAGAYTVPGSVTKIGSLAFSGCYRLTSIVLPTALVEIGNEAFSGCGLGGITIPATVTKIGNSAFSSCRYMRKIIFAGGVPEIGPYSFYGTVMTAYYPANRPEWTADVMQTYGGEVTWDPMGVSGIYNSAFNWVFNESNSTLTISGEGILIANPYEYSTVSAYREQVKEMVVEPGTTVLAEDVFDSFPNLQKVTLPDTVTTISYDAFSDCTSLQEVNIPSSVESIKENAFENCTSLEEVTIPDSVQLIRENAFSNCSSLTEVTVSGSVTAITYSAFDNCNSLQKVTVSDGLEKVDADAFSNCENLTTVVLTERVKTLGQQALAAFPNVTTIHFNGDAPSFDPNAFLGVTATAYYPADKAGWTSNVLQDYGGDITWIAVNNGGDDSGSGSTPVDPPASGGTDTGGGTGTGGTNTGNTSTGNTNTGNTNTGNTTNTTTPTTPPDSTGTATEVIVIEKTDMDAAIEAAGSAGRTEVEISAEDKGTGKEVSLPVGSLEEIVDADLSLSIVTKEATITFDTKALDAIIQQADGEEIQLQYQEIKEAELNSQQKKAIKDQLSDHKGQKHVLTFTVELTGAGSEIHDFNGGTATIKIPFEIPNGTKAEDFAVFYLNSNGEIERYETTYDGQYLIVQLQHFSEYAVIYEPDVAETEPAEAVAETAAAAVAAVSATAETSETQAPSGLQIPFWLILMVVALICVIVLIFLLRKRF